MCGNGCTFENGEKICQTKTEHSLIDVPMEMCDINPRPVCKFQTKLVPKLIPQEQCFKIPREKCELKYEPKEVEKTFETNWCRPLDPGKQTNSGKFIKQSSIDFCSLRFFSVYIINTSEICKLLNVDN